MKTWNYLIPEKYKGAGQSDWNQTLNSMFNEVVNQNNIEERPVVLNIPLKLKPIIETLMFFDGKNIGDKFVVNFNNKDNNIIDVSGFGVEILNF